MKIKRFSESNSKVEELNQLYYDINNLLDYYLIEWKISPKKLKSYLKPGTKRFKDFIEKNNLIGAEQVLVDLLDDRQI